jgi:pilus assembly protein Flp/PilA
MGDTMKKMMLKFLRDQKGLTTVEYAVAGALVTLAVIAAFRLLGGNVANVINAIAGVIVAP